MTDFDDYLMDVAEFRAEQARDDALMDDWGTER